MRVLRTGVTRTVVLIGRWAVKVPAFRPIGTHRGLRARIGCFAQGYLSNLSEATWSGYGPWQGMVAPVLRSCLFGAVQVYPRCDPLDESEWSYGRASVGWHYHGRVPLPTLDPDPGDFKPDNFGWLGCRIVRVDYDMR